MTDLAAELAKMSPEKIEELRKQGLQKIAEEEERKQRVRMTDPHGTVRYLPAGSGQSYPMFIVRQDDPDEEGPYWSAYYAESITVEDGSFDPAEAPIVGRIKE